MIYQLHHQKIKKREETIKIDEREVNSQEELRKFVEDTIKTYSLPEDCVWLIVPENSGYFVK